MAQATLSLWSRPAPYEIIRTTICMPAGVWPPLLIPAARNAGPGLVAELGCGGAQRSLAVSRHS